MVNLLYPTYASPLELGFDFLVGPFNGCVTLGLNMRESGARPSPNTQIIIREEGAGACGPK